MAKFILTLSFFVFAVSILAQSELKFTRYTLDDGLPDNDIMSICQDSIGFMWFGTKKGVCRYDGIEFYRFDDQLPAALKTNWINCMECDSKNRLWFGVAGSRSFLLMYDIENGVFINYTDTIWKQLHIDQVDVSIWSLFADSEGLIWAQPNNNRGGMFVFNPENLKVRVLKNPFDSTKIFPYVRGFYEDNQSNIWINSVDYICKYNKKTDKITKSSFKLSPENTILFERLPTHLKSNKDKQNIWVLKNNEINRFPMDGAMRNNIVKYNFDPEKSPGFLNASIVDFIEINEKSLLFATVNGLFKLDKGKSRVSRFVNDDLDNESINSNNIRSLYHDLHGNTWVGTSNGVAKVKQKGFRSFSSSKYRNSISHNKVQDIYESPNSEIWIATPKGIDVYNRETGMFRFLFGIVKDENGLLGSPLTFAPENNTGVWIGTWRGGFSRYEFATKKIMHTFLKEETKSIGHVGSLLVDRNNNLWVNDIVVEDFSIYVVNLNTGQSKKFSKDVENEYALQTDVARTFFEDSDGTIWIGTYNGLYKLLDFESGKFKTYIDTASVNHITQTKDDYIWVSTNKALYRLNAETDSFKIFSKNNLLPASGVKWAIEDEDRNVWLGTSEGLVKLLGHNSPKPEVTLFRKEEGIDIGTFLDASCEKLSDGTITFGGNKGFCLFNPEDVRKDTITPPIVITKLKIEGDKVVVGEQINNQVVLHKSITKTKKLVLNHKNNVFTIEFAGLNYNMPAYNNYAYILEGYDKKRSQWHRTNAGKKEVNYMNLPAGKYVFKVKASNSSGIWCKNPAVLSIEILPPWWQTWWFRIIVTVCVISLALSFYFYRINALKKQKVILERKVFERTQELREANSQLEEKQEEILQQNEEIITVNNQLKSKNEEILFVNNQLMSKNEEIIAQKDEIQSQKKEIESSRDQLEKAFNDITILSEFGQKLTATFDFDAINKMIYEYVSSLMDTSAFGIGVYNEKRKIIDFPYFMENGKPVPYFYKALSSEKSLSVRCFVNTQEILINDLPSEYKNFLGELPDVQTSKLPSSVIHLPLSVENRPIGTVTVNSFKKNAYNENDIANLRTLASYISIALDNSKAYRIIRSKNEQISGSIRYGQTIQQAMLPPKELIDKYFENFVLFRPKDIVSGDFYWFATVETLHVADPSNVGATSLPGKPMHFLAVVDCTGHGVPGAFMSMIGSRLLNDIVIERKIYSPAKILEQLNAMIKKALRQDTTDNHDGMDVCLCRFVNTGENWELTYAGAKRSLILYNSSSGTIDEIRGTRRSIGGVAARNVIVNFQEEKRVVRQDDVFYLSTDGLVDQCNPQKRKFSQKHLIESILKIAKAPLSDQKIELENELDNFQDGFEQRDDITLLAIKLKS